MEDYKQWLLEHPVSTSIMKYLIWIILIFLVITWVRRIIKKRLPDNTLRNKSQKGIEIIGYFFVILITITYFTGSIKDFGLAIGLLTAVITITGINPKYCRFVLHILCSRIQTWRPN
jgi:multisubunit Na+/H+ antiporter MnhF subunit